MERAEILGDPVLRDLPYKVELNEYGKMVMSPASNRRGAIREELYALLRQQLHGRGRPISHALARRQRWARLL
ncbi:MAG: hypothetical protein V9G63_04385 [Candidatus Competibacter sp.]|jgi:hypothetical protein